MHFVDINKTAAYPTHRSPSFLPYFDLPLFSLYSFTQLTPQKAAPASPAVGGGFWRTFGFHTVSTIEQILDRDGFTLEELLDDYTFLQEVKSQYKRLIDLYQKKAREL
jgi:hypothetical protein